MKLGKIYRSSLLLAAMAAGFGSVAYAGDVEGSPTSNATAGLFSSETDDIQSVTDFSGVEFDKWLAGSNFHKESLDLGFALKFGSIVVSPWYKGYIVDATSTNKESVEVSALTDGSTYKTGETITLTPSDESEEKLNSDFAILVGINDLIGLKLGYSNEGTVTRNGTYWDDSVASGSVNTVVGTDGTVVSKTGTYYDDDGESGTRVHSPYLNLGANLELGSITLKPEIDFTYRMSETYYDTARTRYYTTDDGVMYARNYSADASNKQTDLIPAVSVALELGDAAESFKHTFSLGWQGTFSSFDDDVNSGNSSSRPYSSYGYTINSSTKSYTDYDDHEASSHVFNLGYSIEKEMDENLTLKGGIGLEYYMSHTLTSTQIVTNTTSRTSYGDGTESVTYTTTRGQTNEEETTTSTFSPSIAGGLQYMITEKVRFNGGVLISLPALTQTETSDSTKADASTYEKTVSSNGNITESTTSDTTVTATDTEEKTATWSKVKAEAAIGFTWFLSDNFSLDTSIGYALGESISNCGSLTLGALLKY